MSSTHPLPSRASGLLLALGLALLSPVAVVALLSSPAHAEEPAPEEATAPAEAAPEEAAPAEELPPTDDGDTSDEAVIASAFPAQPSPWSLGLMTSMIALLIGGGSAVLGIWVDRDQQRPVAFAMIMSVLITAAITVGASQSYLDAVGAIEQKQDLERMLNMVSELAAVSGDEALSDIVSAERAQ
jgi:hypothetical protein